MISIFWYIYFFLLFWRCSFLLYLINFFYILIFLKHFLTFLLLFNFFSLLYLFFLIFLTLWNWPNRNFKIIIHFRIRIIKLIRFQLYLFTLTLIINFDLIRSLRLQYNIRTDFTIKFIKISHNFSNLLKYIVDNFLMIKN